MQGSRRRVMQGSMGKLGRQPCATWIFFSSALLPLRARKRTPGLFPRFSGIADDADFISLMIPIFFRVERETTYERTVVSTHYIVEINMDIRGTDGVKEQKHLVSSS